MQQIASTTKIAKPTTEQTTITAIIAPLLSSSSSMLSSVSGETILILV